MPGMNATGPMGAGPQTGRALGYCGKADTDTIFRGRGMGLGKGYSCGRGRGMGRYYQPAELTDEQKKVFLNQRKSFLEKELSSLDEQISNL